MPFDHNDHYHRLLLRHVPRGCRTALDVGCGTGRLALRLAERGVEVDAVDPSAEAIRAASERAPEQPGTHRPRFRQADVTRAELSPGTYDFISCLASLHHMPFGAVAALRDALAPGGTLVVLGCYPETTPADYAWSLAAIPVNAAARAVVALREAAAGTRPACAVRAPVARPRMPLPQIRREAEALLPGCSLRRLLFWRYLLVFRK